MQDSPTSEQIAAAVETARAAALYARATRKQLARRRAPKRAERLKAARDGCATAAEPLRSWIGMVAWHNLSNEQELAMKNAISDLRYERRQIDKMKL